MFGCLSVLKRYPQGIGAAFDYGRSFDCYGCHRFCELAEFLCNQCLLDVDRLSCMARLPAKAIVSEWPHQWTTCLVNDPDSSGFSQTICCDGSLSHYQLAPK
uniref:DUF3795 domain-containing protein n=1 Tax=Panagrellus redivivus TaxID=6233 RepID=A0A7E4V403_PANRE